MRDLEVREHRAGSSTGAAARSWASRCSAEAFAQGAEFGGVGAGEPDQRGLAVGVRCLQGWALRCPHPRQASGSTNTPSACRTRTGPPRRV
jgi:hypothetical protein